jgi:hypothetical protein
MSSQQTNNSNKIHVFDLSGLSDFEPMVGNRTQQVTNIMLTSNLDLYIPRIEAGTTEEYIKHIFEKSRVGTVEYCDISLTKNKDTQKPQHFSAFVKLISWSNLSAACGDFARTKSIRLYLGSRQTGEYWMILPNNNPLPRNHVNNSQLAAATDKLFEQTEKITNKADKFEDEMRATMAEMRQMIQLQQERIETLEFELRWGLIPSSVGKEQVRVELEKNEVEKNEVEKIEERDFEAEVDALLALPMPMMGGVSYVRQMPSLPRNDEDDDEDDLFAKPPPLTRNVSVFQTPVYKEDDCIFSIRQKRELAQGEILRPAPIVSTVTLSLPEIVAKNPERAIESRDFCGNC